MLDYLHRLLGSQGLAPHGFCLLWDPALIWTHVISDALIALAYPDRIGLRRKGPAPRYVLSGGKGAVLAEGDPLGAQRLIVATDLDGDAREARVRIGAALDEADLRALCGDRIEAAEPVEWSRREGRVLARRQERFGALVLSVLVVTGPEMWIGIVLALLGLAIGVLLVLPVGGADVPIVISLLNAFTGLTVAASGYILGNTVLLVAGTLVGASGTFLTLLMAKAMGRSVVNILFGALKGGSTLGAGEASDRPVKSAGPEDVAIMLAYSRKVAIVPGYGLAVAQAQHTVRELVDLLEERGVECSYAIHPVAGRMPGHMNVLLAEANVSYDEVFELEDINSEFAQTDVAFVIGANDVTNPAAKTDKSSAIYGMPILDVERAKTVFFVKRGMASGYAGVENELFFRPNTMMLFGDAKKVTQEIVQALQR